MNGSLQEQTTFERVDAYQTNSRFPAWRCFKKLLKTLVAVKQVLCQAIGHVNGVAMAISHLAAKPWQLLQHHFSQVKADVPVPHNLAFLIRHGLCIQYHKLKISCRSVYVTNGMEGGGLIKETIQRLVL